MKLEDRIRKIEERNERVEENKVWETSLTRRICIAILTYFIVVLYSLSISECNNIFLSSLVPVFGFVLSTLSLKGIRKVWRNKNQD